MPERGRSVVLFVEPFGPSFRSTIQKLDQDPAYRAVECVSSLDAASLARRIGACIIVFHVAREDDFQRHLTMQKLIKHLIQRKTVRLLVTTALRDRALNSKLASQFSAEVLPEPVNEKSLLFKIDRNAKALPQPGAAQVEEGLADSAARGESVSVSVSVELLPPLELESDCWSVVPGAARQLGGRWMVRVRGPMPEHGAWTEVEGPAADAEPAWCWTPKDPENDPFIQEQGSWVFFGRKPEFQGGAWILNAKRPQLGFYYEGESYGSKLSVSDSGQLRVAQDSEATRRALQLLGVDPNDSETQTRSDPELVRNVGAASDFAKGPSLELESDCWLLQSRRPKRVANRWSIPLLGPAPHTGKWLPIEGPETTESYWQWVPNDPENDPFIQEQGSWIFRGFQPKFSDESWVFVSQRPELAFYFEGESYGAKLLTDGRGRLTIAQDSTTALSRRPLMEESMDRLVSAKVVAGSEGGQGSQDDEARIEEAREFRSPQKDFGVEGGEWESVTFGSQQRRWYLYVPAEVLRDQVPDTRKLGRYWSYFGPGSPRRDGGEWVFRERKPQDCALFADLPRPIQEFIAQYFPGTDAAAEAEALSAAKAAAASAPMAKAEAPEFVEFKATPVESSEESVGVELPVSDFGAPGGEWESVAVGSQMRRWYCFVPSEILLSDAPPDIRTLERYWTYFGPHTPSRARRDSGDFYVFEERRPQSVESFGDLPEPVRKFLLEYFSGLPVEEHPVARNASEAAPEAVGPEHVVFEADAREHDAGSLDDFKVFSAATERSQEGAQRRHAHPYEEFGTPCGEWEMVQTASDGRRWFVYVPSELLNGEAEDVRALERYWIYLGPKPPSPGKEEEVGSWIFEERSPQSLASFGDLAQPVQKFLLEYFGKTELEQPDEPGEAEEGVETPDLWFKDEVAESSFTGPDLYLEKRNKQSAALTAQQGVPSAGAGAEDLEISLKPASSKQLEITVAPAPSTELSATVSREAQGPGAIWAAHPPGPSLSPLALTVLMSELIRKRDLDPKRIGNRFCEYLCASMGGLRVELWIHAEEGGWFCGGASDGVDGELMAVFEEFGDKPAEECKAGVKAVKGVGPVFCSPVVVAGASGARVAAGLVITGAGCEKVSEAYARSASKAVIGLVASLRGPVRAAA